MKEELANIVRTFEAVGPLVGNAVKSGQLFNPQAELTEPNPDVLCEYDVRIPVLQKNLWANSGSGSLPSVW